MALLPSQTPEGQRRREQVCDWCREHGIDPADIPDKPAALTVEPVNEAELEVSYIKMLRDKSGQLVEDWGNHAFQQEPIKLTVTDPPPGFLTGWHHIAWDAWGYINLFHQERA